MSSILTNSAAMTALQTLKQTNKNMDITQNRISTGMRISEASHNAAYWSIATTMRSDNSSMSTVQDALGLGAAQVDVAYMAMDNVKETLSAIKDRLVAASQPNVDRAKIQEEITQFQDDLRTSANAATFSGGNWLNVSETSMQQVVASFVREENAIRLETIDIDTSKTALFTNAGDGILQNITPLPVAIDGLGGIRASDDFDGGGSFTVDGFDGITWLAGDEIEFTIGLGDDEPVTVTGAFDGKQWTFNGQPDGLTIDFNATDEMEITGGAAGTEVTVSDFSGIRVATPGLDVSTIAITGGTVNEDGGSQTFLLENFDDLDWQTGDTFSFNIDVDGTDVAVTGTFDGADWVWDHETPPPGINLGIGVVGGDLQVEAENGLPVTDPIGGNNIVVAFDGFASTRESDGVSVTDFDITQLSTAQIGALLNHVDRTLERVITAASDLGAIKTRIESQTTFVSKLMDAVERGIGQLVDADMEEESTRLQALQTQQQLGIQALAIANANSQNILALFG